MPPSPPSPLSLIIRKHKGMKGYTYDEFIADSRTLYHSKEKMRKIKKPTFFFK